MPSTTFELTTGAFPAGGAIPTTFTCDGDDVSPDMTSSMHHDLERGNPLEVRWLSGGVVELGQAKGVATPLNRAIADILALHAQGGSSD